MLPLLAAMFVATARRRRVRRAAGRLDTSAPGERMGARLWWAPDPEGGVAAWVSLYDLGAAPGDAPLLGQPVLGLPDGFEPGRDDVVEVGGDARDGKVVTVRVGETLLRPAGTCREGVGPVW